MDRRKYKFKKCSSKKRPFETAVQAVRFVNRNSWKWFFNEEKSYNQVGWYECPECGKIHLTTQDTCMNVIAKKPEANE